MDKPYAHRTWQSADGLTLHYRDYAGPDGVSDKPPILCMHGLTRNARDFATLADHLGKNWRVIVPEMRGRGRSDYAPDSATYTPVTYVQDVEALLADQNINRFVAIGTSMGGLMTMMMAAGDAMQGRSRIAGAVLNDIGPVIDTGGLDKIRTYLGQGGSYATWMHAARALRDVHSAAHPDFDIERWLEMAKRTLVLGQSGRLVFDYDMAIAEPFKAADENAAPPDLWPAFDALGEVPLLLLRGELSNLLSAETAAAMQARKPQMEVVTVPRCGHAPVLDEPESVAAIDRLLEKIA
ncbi:alpha/beta fold hydrolase [Qipengyuania sp. DSG2-2]|uniref:alpha/beta fold hydrolase n=1 Tax=Qipengyuania sp. DGS2-2 TaxID=3349631 RepID=UPI0036D30186